MGVIGFEAGVSEALGECAILLIIEQGELQADILVQCADVRWDILCRVDDQRWDKASDDDQIVHEVAEFRCQRQAGASHESDLSGWIPLSRFGFFRHRASSRGIRPSEYQRPPLPVLGDP